MENADSNVEIGKFVKGDVVVKGANAIDHTGLTGTYASSLKCRHHGRDLALRHRREAVNSSFP